MAFLSTFFSCYYFSFLFQKMTPRVLVLLFCVPFILAAELNPCILQCVTTAVASAECISLFDSSCICSSSQFQTDSRQCIQEMCTPQE
jgi:hypothetical protein